jgi:hypothetical protein
MMQSTTWRISVAVCVMALLVPVAASAQTIGTFRWQTQPFCNVLTLSISLTGAGYRLEGNDDQCGAPIKASAIGMALPNADGSIEVGLTIVSPGAAVLHLDATLQINTGFSGTWHDTVGRSGPWLFTPGAGVGGPLRPVVGPVSYGSVLTQPSGASDRGLSVTVASDTGTPNDAAGVYGRFGAPIAPLESAAPAGVRGDSGANVGVYGLSATGFGVAGGAQTGVGVQGYALGGAGSIGVQAVHGAGGTALEINNGTIKVAGDVRAAFTLPGPFLGGAGGGNSVCTQVDHPLLNGDPYALLFLTSQSSGGGLSVKFAALSGGAPYWAICNAGLTIAGAVNVLVIKQ